MRYANVGEYGGASYDLVVRAASAVTRLEDEHTDGYSGCNGLFGVIAIQSGTHVNLTFSFEDSQTGEAVTLPRFEFSIFDLDNGGQEEVEVGGFTSYALRRPLSNIQIVAPRTFRSCDPSTTCVHPPESCPSTTGGCPSTSVNPTDPQALDDQQKANAITMQFDRPTSSFDPTVVMASAVAEGERRAP